MSLIQINHKSYQKGKFYCPICHNECGIGRPKSFKTVLGLMIHIGQNHTIPQKTYLKIRKCARKYDKDNQDKMFFDLLINKGVLF